MPLLHFQVYTPMATILALHTSAVESADKVRVYCSICAVGVPELSLLQS